MKPPINIKHEDYEVILVYHNGEKYYQFKDKNGDIVLVKFDKVMREYLDSLETGEQYQEEVVVERERRGFLVTFKTVAKKTVRFVTRGVLIEKIMDVLEELF